jgi:hypothetical protein
MSAASEALLQDILDQARVTNNNLATMLRQSASSSGGGGSSNGGGTNPIAQNIARFNVLNGVLTSISAVGNIVSNVFSSIGNFAGKLAGEFVTLAEKAFQGTAKFGDLFGAATRLTQALPLLGAVLTPLMGIFEKIIVYQETLLGQYQSLTKSGASFSGSLIEMRLAASRAYLTLDQFSKIVRENSSLFATAIGGVNAGIKIFTAAQNKLVDPNGPFGKNLLGLGYTAEEASEMLGMYISMQGSLNRANRQNTSQMAESTNNLIMNLDAYAKLTGESKESLEKKLKEQALDEELKAFLSSLNPDEVASANQALAAAMVAGGKGLQDEVKVRIMSNNKVQVAGTEAANNLRVSSRNQSAASADFYFQAFKMGQGSKNFVSTLENGRRTLADGTGKFFNAVGGPGMAGVISTVGGGFKVAAEQAKTFNRLNGETLTTEQRLQEIRKEQEKQFNSTAAALSAAQMQLKIFGNQIGERFFRMLEPLNGPIMEIGHLLMDAFGGTINYLTAPNGPMNKLGTVINDYIAPAITWAANWIKDTFTSLASSNTTQEFFKNLSDRFKIAWEKISEVLGPPMKKFWEETAKPMLADVFTGIMDWIITALRKNSRIARWLFNETDTEKQEKLARKEDPLYQELVKKFTTYQHTRGGRIAKVDEQGAIEAYEKEKLRLASEARDLEKQRLINDSARLEVIRTLSERGRVVGGRAGGSLGATGGLFENFGSGTPMELHGTEGVVTPGQMSDIVANAVKQGENTQLLEKFNQLTALTQQLVTLMQENANNSRRSLDAIQNLNGNLLA